MRNIFGFIIGCVIIFFLNSCGGLYPSTMFKQKDYQYFELAQKKIEEYNIASGDQLRLEVYSRDGFMLLDMINSDEFKTTAVKEAQILFLVDEEGFVNFPIIGELFVRGYTETQLKNILKDKLASIYVDPFIVLKVENRRAIVITAAMIASNGLSSGGKAQIVELNQSPTSIIEVIAKAGGILGSSRANKIKVIRGDLKNPQVIEVNLATIEGVRKSAMDVLPNDIIYIDSKRNVLKTILADAAPYIGLTASITSIILLIRTLGK
jgi:polysaccharide export outer membrane protein